MARLINEKWIGTTGKYKVTEEYEEYEDLVTAVTMQYLQWEDVGKLMAAQHDYFMKQIEAIQLQIGVSANVNNKEN